VPYVSFFTGFHSEYHTPYDTADLVDAAGIEAIASFGSDLLFDLATLPDRLIFDRDGAQGNLKENPQEKEQDERVRVGLIPAARSTGDGMFIARVSEGTSAAKGGLRQGDRITKWNGVPINEVADWTALLDAHKPGDRVTVEYLRAGESQTTELILQGEGDE
jgi:C-terminal processing protease CtpA/Prc